MATLIEKPTIIEAAGIPPKRIEEFFGRVNSKTESVTLIGTWAAAEWAIRFYQKHGFRLVTPADKDRLLPKYWGVPVRQIETSVVLGDQRWFDHN